MTSKLHFIGPWQRLTLTVWSMALLGLYFADIDVISLEPWNEFSRMLLGFITPDFFATESLFHALWLTVSFALLGVVCGLLIGIPLAFIYQSAVVAGICAMVRGIHEIFWALLFLQLFGLSPITGIVAIALPYGATFARVFHDILQQAPSQTGQNLPSNIDRVSGYVYGKLGHVYPLVFAYVRYRFECALRSSAVLGFVGMPTVGFYLETAFRQGNYHEGAALLILLILLVGSISFWAKRALMPIYLLLALFSLPPMGAIDGMLIWQFVSHDLLPPGIKAIVYGHVAFTDGLVQCFHWWQRLTIEQALPATAATLVLAITALGATHLLALTGYACASRHRCGNIGAGAGQLVLLLLRSTPEYLLAFIFMMLLGPSMLPAIAALALHNGALIAYLVSRQDASFIPSNTYKANSDHFAFEILPRIYPNLMSLLFYRFEVILRETAIFGVLGIATLGFYIDSAFAEIRYSNALYLLMITALLNVVVDVVARRLLARQLPQGVNLGQPSCIS
ncbi:ABC transporter permease [Shewanella sp. Isolate11]|uniref:PhnE/PtxC family ABC transporter permease n=1 Tax=Shewanella sp. Isolate11 TaxID=2908530 RepID=UPI001EFD7793|nr:ABC transporter permease [Shewanella sp. Isolate11]MCG9696360.1 ABC transporter permease [Shewanella sp. Isolate11]